MPEVIIPPVKRMTQIDEQIDNILLEHIVLATDNGQPYIKSTDTAVEAIKALISDQVAKARIDELRQHLRYDDAKVDPMKLTARTKVRNAVKDGKIVKGQCFCGEPRVELTDAHHLFGYEPEDTFAIVWLCRSHHLKLHKLITIKAQEAYDRGYADKAILSSIAKDLSGPMYGGIINKQQAIRLIKNGETL